MGPGLVQSPMVVYEADEKTLGDTEMAQRTSSTSHTSLSPEPRTPHCERTSSEVVLNMSHVCPHVIPLLHRRCPATL